MKIQSILPASEIGHPAFVSSGAWEKVAEFQCLMDSPGSFQKLLMSLREQLWGTKMDKAVPLFWRRVLWCRKDDPQRPLAAVPRTAEGPGQAVKPVERLL